jgi:murein DD-endopeptidase MepM/ murein hydrolase activator NlpD
VKAQKLYFHCEELHEKQEQEREKKKADKTPSLLVIPTDSGGGNPRNTDAEPGAQKRKKKGVNWSKADVTIKNAKPDTEQTDAIEICMGVADRLHASPKAVKAMVVAGIGESEFRPSAAEQIYGTHKGVFQSGQIDQFDTEQQCTYFFKGGRSFLAGGAMGLVKSQPSLSVGTVAAKVEISDGSAAYYDGFAGEADKIIEAFGGAGAGTTAGDTGGEYRKQYNFEVGGPDHPGESYWEAMQRLAGDVKWALFVDGTHVYYDAETTLIRQKPAAYINRLDETVVSFSSTWDQRNIASEASLDLICDPFEFRAGDTIKLIGFGPSSTGSSVTPPLPGRWLIAEIDRDRFDFVSTLRLVQPTKPGPEPQAQKGSHAADASEAGGSGPGAVLGNTYKYSPVPGQKPHSATHETAGLPGYPAYDYMAPAGTPVVAPEDGSIRKLSGRDPKLGGDPGGPLGYSIYVHAGATENDYFLTHLDKVTVKVGDTVHQGQQIAEVAHGPASWSTPHCHCGVKKGRVDFGGNLGQSGHL